VVEQPASPSAPTTNATGIPKRDCEGADRLETGVWVLKGHSTGIP
jgi:hypothetical protein